MQLNLAWRILFGLGTVATALPVQAAPQTGQPESAPAPAMSRDGAGLTTSGRAQAATPNQPTQFNPTEPLPPAGPAGMAGKEGIKAGSFLLFPEIGIGATYDTNLFATRSNETKDWMWSFTPSLIARSDWKRHKLSFRIGSEADRYDSNPAQNTDDYWADAQGTYDISGNTNVYGGLGASRSHEDRSSPDLSFGSEPTKFTDTNAFAGIYHDFGQVYGRFGVVTSKLDFSNVPTSAGGVLINATRNRDVTSVGGRLAYRATSIMDLFVQGNTDRRSYETTPDASGYFRDSHGNRIDVGASFNVMDRIVGEAFIGRMSQDYEDARLSDVSTVDYGGSLRWHTSPWNTVRLSLDRTLNETVIPGASSYLDTSFTARVEHEISRDTLATAGFTTGKNDFQGTDRIDRYSEASAGVRHYISQAVSLGAEYSFMNRSSNYLDANYHRNLVMFTLTSDFGARRRTPYFDYPERDLSLTSVPGKFDGFYLGGQFGFGALTAESYGMRDMQPNNTDSGQFGNADYDYGLFAGLGKAFGSWYLGAELAADQGNAELSHIHNSANPAEALDFSIRQKDSVAASLRLGYILPTGPLLYSRFGVARTTFNNVLQDETATVDVDNTQNGTLFGIGTDIPDGDHAFVRMDYTYTRYDSYDVAIVQPAPNGYSEQYTNSGGYFRLGLGWRFGGPATKHTQVDPTYLRGLYAGAGVGYDGVLTRDNTLHYHPGYGYDTLAADFGREGFAGGAYAGYGYTIGRWYAGAELNVEASTVGWLHDRVTSGGGGRDFAVNKKGGHGYGLRVGYVLDNGSLLYARLGRVSTKFNSYYAQGNSTPVDRDDTVQGTRIGLGAELPINKASFVRLDYAVTHYAAIPAFQSASATPDTVNFDNRETQFQVGLGFRF
ncbi:MAG TPA: outer membrane beta-barrel protein [Parasulfuritortus sp.]